ncbi:MAG: hypothetical protein CSA55_05740 [Ilumatobacter coccineus]|uniref:Peptidase C60 family protein n=1 Tax=Ilumatobacter coccineus TaxID=467094 RepID=A0A2G6K6W1_9ACTN|nr:MAG: hypothetical protein CSA55_05740 [Ilumatobacter coccineus]
MSSTTPPLDSSQSPRFRRRSDRVSYWDRPPAPRDWRFVVGGAGRLMVWLGVMMFGFVAYQLWGTGINTARDQRAMAEVFEQTVGGSDASNGQAETTDGEPTTPKQEPALTANEVADLEVSSIVPGAVNLSSVAVEQNIPRPIPGQALFRLQIPAINKDLFVVPGVKLSDLKKGPGHYPDTPMPGQLGNAAIAGHRTTYGAPFGEVGELNEGDKIIITNLAGENFVYLVTSTEIVQPRDYWVVTTRDPTVAELTLTSCHPKRSARQRFVVHAILDPTQSAQVGKASFYTLDRSASDDSDDAETASEIEDDPVVDDTTDTAVDGDNTVVREVDADVFTQGWFDDPGAWPQIALWGLALLAVMAGAYQLAKWRRSILLGLVVGVVPYVVISYFWFENILRLLPPGL